MDDPLLPVYRSGKKSFTSKEVVRLLTNPPTDKICRKKPTYIQHDVTFIVDITKLTDAKATAPT